MVKRNTYPFLTVNEIIATFVGATYFTNTMGQTRCADKNADFDAYNRRKTELSIHRECLLWENRVAIPEKLQDCSYRLPNGHPSMMAINH